MNTYPNSIYAPAGSAPTVGAAPLTRTARTARTKDFIRITSGILTVTRRGLSLVARIFDGIAEQRDRQAKQIVAYYGQDRWSDSIEREIGPAHPGKGSQLNLGAWHWQ